MIHPVLKTSSLFIILSPVVLGQTAKTDTSYIDKFGTTTPFADSATVVVVRTNDSPGINVVKGDWYTPEGQLMANTIKKFYRSTRAKVFIRITTSRERSKRISCLRCYTRRRML